MDNLTKKKIDPRELQQYLMVFFLVHFVFKRKSQSMLCRVIYDERFKYNSCDMCFFFLVFSV